MHLPRSDGHPDMASLQDARRFEGEHVVYVQPAVGVSSKSPVSRAMTAHVHQELADQDGDGASLGPTWLRIAGSDAARLLRDLARLHDCYATARLLHDYCTTTYCTTAARCDSSLRGCCTTARCESSLTTAALTIPTSQVHCYHIASPLLSHHMSTAALTSPHRKSTAAPCHITL